MSMASKWRHALLLLLAAAGTTAGHWLAYVAASAPHDHGALLHETGHGSEGLVGLALRALVAALFVAAAQSVVISRTDGTKRFSLLVRLAGWQLAAFTALEASERIGAPGAGLSELAGEPVFLVGLLIQVFVAGCIFFAVRAVAQVVTRLLDLIATPSSDSASLGVDSTSLHRPRLLSLPVAGWSLRGPPPVL